MLLNIVENSNFKKIIEMYTENHAKREYRDENVFIFI